MLPLNSPEGLGKRGVELQNDYVFVAVVYPTHVEIQYIEGRLQCLRWDPFILLPVYKLHYLPIAANTSDFCANVCFFY